MFISRLQIALAFLSVVAFLVVIFFNYMPLEKKLHDSVSELEKIAWRQSHLLRAPVANIIGLSKLLLRNPERQMSDETKHLLSMISTETEKMDQEIHKIVQSSSRLSSKNDIF